MGALYSNNMKGQTPVHEAASKVFFKLLGVMLNYSEELKALQQIDNEGRTPVDKALPGSQTYTLLRRKALHVQPQGKFDV